MPICIRSFVSKSGVAVASVPNYKLIIIFVIASFLCGLSLPNTLAECVQQLCAKTF